MKKLTLILLFFIPLLALGQAKQRWEYIEEISNQAKLAKPDTADWLLIEDVSDANKRKKISVSALAAGLPFNFDSANIAQQFFRSGQFVAVPGDNDVTFSSPFPDANYSVFANATYNKPRQQPLIIRNQTAAGFTIKGVIDTALVNWTAQREVEKLGALIDTLVKLTQNIAGADSFVYSNDTLYLQAADSVLSYAVIQGGSGSTAFRYYKILSLNENIVDVGTDITQATLVFVNGYAYTNYTYSGTEINLGGAIFANDYLTVAQTGDTPLYQDYLIDSETIVSLPFTTTSNSLPFYNGTILQPPQYTGSITLDLYVNENDNLIVKQ